MLFTFSITTKPDVGNADASAKVIVVAESVIAPFKVVDNCKVVIATPPTGDLISLSLKNHLLALHHLEKK